MAISMLKTKPEYFKWTSAEWRRYYYETIRTVTDTYADGTIMNFDQRTMNLPALIVNTWVRTVFSNTLEANIINGESSEKLNYIVDNKLLVGERFGAPYYYNLKPFVESTLAYGSILIDYDVSEDRDNLEPKIITSYRVIKKKDNPYPAYEYDKRVSKSKNVKVYHKYDNGAYRKYIDNVEVWSNPEYPLAFESVNIYTLDDGSSIPIYGYAIPNIEEANDAYNELGNNRVLSRKIVMVPRTMETTNRAKLDKAKSSVPILDKTNRVFRVYDTKNESNNPTVVDGNFNPQSNIDDINVHLKLAGVHSGLGFKRFSMDNTGTIKTAEEVQSDNYEYAISEVNIIDEVLGNLASNLLTRAYERIIIVDVKGHKDDLETMDVRDSRLLKEYQAGLISMTDYHRLRGVSEEDIKKLDITKAGTADEYANYMNGVPNV